MPTPADHYRAAEEFATLAHQELSKVDPDAFWVSMVVSAGQLEATLALAVEAHQEAALEDYARSQQLDQRAPGEPFCEDCPDHEGCSQGVPCSMAKQFQ